MKPVLSQARLQRRHLPRRQAGKNGFKLSLRGYDPIFDHRALTDDLDGRRFNRAAPETQPDAAEADRRACRTSAASLMQPGEPYYELVRRWIAEGVKLDLDAAARDVASRSSRRTRSSRRSAQKQQFAVIATYADGTRPRRDRRGVRRERQHRGRRPSTRPAWSPPSAAARRPMLARYEGAYAATHADRHGRPHRLRLGAAAGPQLHRRAGRREAASR